MSYTRSQLKARISARIKNKQGMLLDFNGTVNDAVREVISQVKLRSQKRKSTLAPNLFSDVYQYNCPTDLDDQSIVDLSPQVLRTKFSDWMLTMPEEFDRKKATNDRLLAILDHDNVKKLLVSKRVNDEQLIISTMDADNAGGGTWTVIGDAENLTEDNDDYINGGASLKFDIGSGATTTAGLKNTSLTSFDFTEYKNNSVFAWVYITSTTNLTNFILRLGSSDANYYEKTVTTTNEGTAFVQGWNLLRFDFGTASTTGSPTITAFTYAALFMTKTAGKINETGYRFDYLVAKKGKIYNLFYYSNYPWETSAGTWIANSTDDSDLLHADETEFTMFVEKGVELAGMECEEDDASTKAGARFVAMADNYGRMNPDESLVLMNQYYEF